MSDKELKQYWFHMTKEEISVATRARIHEFKELGWIDPFAPVPKLPSEQVEPGLKREGTKKGFGSSAKKATDMPAKLLRKNTKNLPEKTHTDENAFDYVNSMVDDLDNIRSIYALALPSEQLMFNMMRACVGATEIEDLWFYHKRLLYND